MSSFVAAWVGPTVLGSTILAGVATGALIGAGVSVASTLVNGGSILDNGLKGAVAGGTLGGVAGGISSALSSAASSMSSGTAVSITSAEQQAMATDILSANSAAGGAMTMPEAMTTAQNWASAGYTPQMTNAITNAQTMAIQTGVDPTAALRLTSQGYSVNDIQTMLNNGSDVTRMNSLGNSLPDPSAAISGSVTNGGQFSATEKSAMDALTKATGKSPTLAQQLGLTNAAIGAVGQGAAALYGASLNADAAKAATAETSRQFNIGQANAQPWLNAGKTALSSQLDLLGLPGGTAGGTPNALTALHNTPGYQFQVDQGNRALAASTAARGGMGSGKAATDALSYGQNLADTTYNQSVNRLAALSGTGQTQANTSAAAGANYAGTVGTSVINQAAATQSGITGAANALSGYLNPPKQIVGYNPQTGAPIYG